MKAGAQQHQLPAHIAYRRELNEVALQRDRIDALVSCDTPVHSWPM